MKKFYSLKEASKNYDLKESYIRAKVFSKEISYYKVGRLIMFTQEDLDEFMTRNRVEVQVKENE